MNKVNILALSILIMTAAFYSAAADNVQADIQTIMKMEHRDDDDRKRDLNRTPDYAMAFWGIQPDMKVIEFAPGNGWYTKILAPYLHDEGDLYLAYNENWLSGLKPLLSQEKMNKAKPLAIELDWNNQESRYELGALDFKMNDADMVLSIREYHNFNAADKIKMNEAIFKALKSGGKYIVVDHSRRHMQAETFELRRREDPVDVIQEVQQAGFFLFDHADMFYKPDDELRYEVGRKSVTGNTDRFSLVFVKP